jgi:hypothetical protein
MPTDLLWTARGAVAALLAAAAWAVALRLARRADLAAAAAGVGLAVGWSVTLGLITASPRQVPERLPLLALAAVLGAVGFAASPRLRRAWPAATVLAALLAGWWMAGAPRTWPDLRRAAPVGLGVAAVAAWLALRGLRDAWWSLAAAVALATGLLAARVFGPAPWLALAAAAAAAGALVGRSGFGFAAAMPFALGLAALAAVPAVARGGAADWAAVAAPALVLALGPMLSARLGARFGPPFAWALVAAPAVLAAWWFSSRMP